MSNAAMKVRTGRLSWCLAMAYGFLGPPEDPGLFRLAASVCKQLKEHYRSLYGGATRTLVFTVAHSHRLYLLLQGELRLWYISREKEGGNRDEEKGEGGEEEEDEEDWEGLFSDNNAVGGWKGPQDVVRRRRKPPLFCLYPDWQTKLLILASVIPEDGGACECVRRVLDSDCPTITAGLWSDILFRSVRTGVEELAMLMVEERCRRVVSATESKSDTETALLDCFKMAARSGLVRLVRFAVESPVWIWPGCLPSMAVESVLTAAVEGKQLEILRLTEGVCKNRFGLSASIFSRVVLRASAEFGFLEGLEKEFDRGGDGDGGRQVSALKERLCADAAKGGQLETLRVLREKRKCGWGKEVVERASVMGHCQIVRYAALQGCPFLATETLANLAFACAVARSERQESEILGTFRWVFATVAAVRDGERGRARTSSSSSRSPANAIDPRGGLELTQVWATAAHWGADMILHWAAEQPEDVVPPESLFSASVRERAKRGRKKEIADWLLEMSKKRGQRVIERDDERIEHEGE